MRISLNKAVPLFRSIDIDGKTTPVIGPIKPTRNTFDINNSSQSTKVNLENNTARYKRSRIDSPASKLTESFFMRNPSKYGKLSKKARRPMGSCEKNLDPRINGSSRKMDGDNDVRVNVKNEVRYQGAASPPPDGGLRQIGTIPGDFQRRKRDSEKISRNENEKIILYDDVSQGSEP